jgi:Integrase core domain
MQIEEVPTAPRSPFQNPYAERVIGSIRRECLDHLIIIGEDHLRRTLRNYIDYYHNSRPHRSLDQNSPIPDPSNPERKARSSQSPRSAAFIIGIGRQLDVVGVELVPTTDWQQFQPEETAWHDHVDSPEWAKLLISERWLDDGRMACAKE